MKRNLLEVIPQRNGQVVTEEEGDGVVLALPRFKNAWMQKHLIPRSISPYVRVTLEEHGSAVWKLVDGKRTVGEIIEELAGHFNHEDGYESRIASFIMQMGKDGLIRFTGR